jgi:hypothetical protein
MIIKIIKLALIATVVAGTFGLTPCGALAQTPPPNGKAAPAMDSVSAVNSRFSHVTAPSKPPPSIRKRELVRANLFHNLPIASTTSERDRVLSGDELADIRRTAESLPILGAHST